MDSLHILDNTHTYDSIGHEESKGEEEEFPWSKYDDTHTNADFIVADDDVSWTHHYSTEVDWNVQWPALPSPSQYHILKDDYDWTPDIYTTSLSGKFSTHELEL